MGSLVLVERELTARLPAFTQILPRQLTAERLMRTVLVACERTPKLLECTQQSIVASATTAAVLGLEVDGVTGQGFLIPYKQAAQFQIGYKGYPTIAARSGLSINAAAVREGDEFDYELGTDGFVHHKPMLAAKIGRKIIATWAIATASGRPPLIAVMSYPEVLAIKEKSPGARKQDSPWNDINGPGHEAMVVKTGIRRLGRTVPVVAMQLAAALDGAQEAGHTAYLDPGGNLRTVGEGATPGAANGRHQPPPAERQAEDVEEDAGGFPGDHQDWAPPEGWPTFERAVEFDEWSNRFLDDATIPQAKAWKAQHRGGLDNLANGNPTQQRIAAGLNRRFDNIIAGIE